MLNIFGSNRKPERISPFKKEDMQEYIDKNRAILDTIDNWIDDRAFSESFFNYGAPDHIKKDINKKINTDITYSDIMVYIANKYFRTVNYLEIGVSVGKNFLQVINSCPGLANASGFDIENINPVLEKQLSLISEEKWDTLPNSIKKDRSSLRKYSFGKIPSINYLSGDVWDENNWAKMKNSSFNLIFSDALHTPEAIIFEFEMLVKYNLCAEKFVIVWDDIVGGMQEAFFKIYRKYNKKFNAKEYYLINTNGWVGQYEQEHSIGIISNFKFRNP
ncbi:MAG: class I SAM-dependent methyltransferase [Prevotella sp.]|jgi:hypothetical protein|nr:class I SAM-dependent methyltransferase [Prevotella sp.]